MTQQPVNRTNAIRMNLVARVLDMLREGTLDAAHAARITQRITGPYSEWLVSPEPPAGRPRPPDREARSLAAAIGEVLEELEASL